MALSEEEKRILQELEKNLYDSDADFAERVSSESVYTFGFRRAIFAVVVLLSALAFSLYEVSHSIALSYVGFLAMVAAGLWIADILTKVFRAGTEDLRVRFKPSFSRGEGSFFSAIKKLLRGS